MLARLIAGTLCTGLVAAFVLILSPRVDPAVESARALLGERWYRLVLNDRHIGHLHTRTRREATGRWQFTSEMRFVLNTGNPVRTLERLTFGGEPPYALVSAYQRREQADGTQETVIERTDHDYQVRRGSERSEGIRQPLSLSFTLADHLGSESLLRESAPSPGATISAASLDFGRARVVTRKFRVAERNAAGYVLESAAPVDPSRIQLDARFRPVAMTLAGLFELRQATRIEAMAPRGALPAASYTIPTDRSLENHTNIRALTIEVEGADADTLWPDLSRGGRVHRVAGAVSSAAPIDDDLAETADHPTSDYRLRALADEAIAKATRPREQARRLTAFVHNYLSYQEDGVNRPVGNLPDDPRGDCTEFADLLTTLARIAHIPSRTVFGLAYADRQPPAFQFHAWNELWIDGAWLAVDPTWNQTRLDATHLPMPSNTADTLELLTGGLPLRFVIQNVEYF